MADFDFLTAERFTEVAAFALRKPPTWTRLEPQTRSGDPRPGIEARVHDPLWLIGRQWQFGEFEGEDAGTPLSVRVVTTTTDIDRWAATEGDSQPLAPGDLLEPAVERETGADPAGPGLRARVEAGAAFLTSLTDGGLTGAADYRQAVLANCPMSFAPSDHPGGSFVPSAGPADPAEAFAVLDPEWGRLTRLLAGRAVADAEQLCAATESDGGLPAWLTPFDAADETELRSLLAAWSTWYRAEISPRSDGPDAWVGARLEYQFRLGAGAATVHAPAHLGGETGWSTFDVSDQPLAEPPGGQPERSARQVHSLLASPLRYPGMPADRLWELEDGQVNFGRVDAEPWDLARLLVAEFALSYGNDWLVVPIDVPYGTITRVESVYFLTTFGERYRVRSSEESGAVPDGDWRMFTLTGDDTGSPGLLIPPGAIAVADGPPLEDVLFLRDEMANLAWAVERSVTGPSGAARDRSREQDGNNPPSPKTVPHAELDYTLQTLVPARWIPYLPRTNGYRSIELAQGRMPDADGTPVPPLGRLLNTAEVATIFDAEIPREGVSVRRVPSVTRRADGSYVRWLTRRVTVGRGEGASQLHFDAARSREPRPNTSG